MGGRARRALALATVSRSGNHTVVLGVAGDQFQSWLSHSVSQVPEVRSPNEKLKRQSRRRADHDVERETACRGARERNVWTLDTDDHWLHSPNAACASRSQSCESCNCERRPGSPADSATLKEEQKDESYLSSRPLAR